MENFRYTVIPALYQSEGGPEAQVGDQVKLYLNTDAQPGFPEFVTGVIQHPIVRVCDGTQYTVEYDPADLEGAADLLVTGDVVSALVVTAVELLEDRFTPIETAVNAAVFHDGVVDSANKLTKYDDDSRLGAAELLVVSPGTVPADNPASVRVVPTGVILRAEGEAHYRQIIPTNASISQNYGIEVPAADGVVCLTSDPSGTPDSLTATTPPIFPVYTVAGLPPAANFPYGRAFVSDSADGFGPATVGTVGFSGGGSNKVPVYSDGSVWIIG